MDIIIYDNFDSKRRDERRDHLTSREETPSA
jgi:hypothetical protein